jgi:hypothetical protein
LEHHLEKVLDVARWTVVEPNSRLRRVLAGWSMQAHVHQEIGGVGVGAVGMCVTGNFALTMTLDPWVVAPVLAHPSFPLPITRRKAAALHVTPETLDNARRRIRGEGLKVLGIRFTGDVAFCRAARFETLRRELGDGLEEIQVPGRSAKPHLEPPHSVLTIGLVDKEGEPTRAAVHRVIEFLEQRLKRGDKHGERH